jgi:hypothetical protein
LVRALQRKDKKEIQKKEICVFRARLTVTDGDHFVDQPGRHTNLRNRNKDRDRYRDRNKDKDRDKRYRDKEIKRDKEKRDKEKETGTCSINIHFVVITDITFPILCR